VEITKQKLEEVKQKYEKAIKEYEKAVKKRVKAKDQWSLEWLKAERNYLDAKGEYINAMLDAEGNELRR